MVADLLRGEIFVILLIDSGGNRLRKLAAHGADRHAAGLDGPVDDRGLEVDKLVDIFIFPVQMEEVQPGGGSRCKEALVKRRAEFGVVCRRELRAVGVRNRKQNSRSARSKGALCVVNMRLRQYVKGVEQSLRILLLEANDLLLRRKFDCDLPGIESSFENLRIPAQSVTDQL